MKRSLGTNTHAISKLFSGCVCVCVCVCVCGVICFNILAYGPIGKPSVQNKRFTVKRGSVLQFHLMPSSSQSQYVVYNDILCIVAIVFLATPHGIRVDLHYTAFVSYDICIFKCGIMHSFTRLCMLVMESHNNCK